MELLTKVFLGILISLIGSSINANPNNRFDGDTLALPFVEEFTTGLLETNGWTVEGTNWHVAGQAGNPAPSVEFTYYPVLSNYDISLISPFIDGNSVTDCRIYLDFDIRFDDNIESGNENLFVEVFSDTSWNEVAQFVSNGDFDWTSKKLNITTNSRSKIFKVRFRTTGISTLDLNSWLIDNINIHMVCEPPLNLESSIPDPFSDWVLLEWDPPCNQEVDLGDQTDTCHVLGYYVYHNEEYIATTSELSYLNELSPNDPNCYRITAMYNDGESDFSNEKCVPVDVDKIIINSIAITPNPASDIVQIKLAKGIERIVILDLTGRISGQYSIDPSLKEYAIDVSNFNPGVYLVRFLTPTSSVERKLIIQ